MCVQVLLGLETEQENKEFYQLWVFPISIWPQQLLFSSFDTPLLYYLFLLVPLSNHWLAI